MTARPAKSVPVWLMTLAVVFGLVGSAYKGGLEVLGHIEELVAEQVAMAFDPIVLRQDALQGQLANVNAQLASIGNAFTEKSDPPWAFSRFRVADGAPGDRVKIEVARFKDAECGAPIISLWFRNGGNMDHRFKQLSIVDGNGRGVDLPVDPEREQTLTYTAGLPAFDGLRPGRAFAFISLDYSAVCPRTDPVRAGPAYFQILPQTQRPLPSQSGGSP